MALVNYYTDGTPEGSGNQDVKYYTFDNITAEELIPLIDVCYKEVPIEECEPPYVPVGVIFNKYHENKSRIVSIK